MGKGDKKTRRGKIVIGSTGVRRPRKKKGHKPIIHNAVVTKAEEIQELTPVSVPEISPMGKQFEEKVPRKAAVKKAGPKKTSVKIVEGETKPTPAKSKKKPARKVENPTTEKKDDTEN